MSTDVLSLVLSYFASGMTSLAASLVIVATQGRHLRYTARGHGGSVVQSMHRLPTPRIGGIGLILGISCAIFLADQATGELLMLIALSAVPVFLAGFCEDVGIGASPKVRLLAAMAGSFGLIAVSGFVISDVGIPGVNSLLLFLPVAAAFTVFATAGVAHAFNLIDGLNGLSTGVGMVAAAALALMALQVDDIVVAQIATALLVSILGVFLVNYPLGKLFLGDAGAYTLGHVIGWLVVILLARNPGISPWALLLVVFWPVMDTFASIVRRWQKKMPVGMPDRMHFHHIVLRMMRSTLFPRNRNWASNSSATLAMVPLFMIPGALAVIFADNDLAAALSFAFCMMMYLGVRLQLVRSFRTIARGVKRRILRRKATASLHASAALDSSQERRS